MKAELTFNGYLLLTAENSTEEFALRKWYELHGDTPVIPAFPSRLNEMDMSASFMALNMPPVELNARYIHKELGLVRVVGFYAQTSKGCPPIQYVEVRHEVPESADLSKTDDDAIYKTVYHVHAEHLQPLTPKQPTEIPSYPK